MKAKKATDNHTSQQYSRSVDAPITTITQAMLIRVMSVAMITFKSFDIIIGGREVHASLYVPIVTIAAITTVVAAVLLGFAMLLVSFYNETCFYFHLVAFG